MNHGSSYTALNFIKKLPVIQEQYVINAELTVSKAGAPLAAAVNLHS